MFFTLLEMVLWLWHVLTAFTELIQCMTRTWSVLFHWPRGFLTLGPWGSSLHCAGQGEDSCFLRLSSHTASVDFHPTAFLRDLPGPGNRISQPPLGIECQRGSLHFLRPPWHSGMERSPPSTTNLQRQGWFPKGHTRGRLFRVIRWDDSTFLLTPTSLSSHSCLPIIPFLHSYSTE